MKINKVGGKVIMSDFGLSDVETIRSYFEESTNKLALSRAEALFMAHGYNKYIDMLCCVDDSIGWELREMLIHTRINLDSKFNIGITRLSEFDSMCEKVPQATIERYDEIFKSFMYCWRYYFKNTDACKSLGIPVDDDGAFSSKDTQKVVEAVVEYSDDVFALYEKKGIEIYSEWIKEKTSEM